MISLVDSITVSTKELGKLIDSPCTVIPDFSEIYKLNYFQQLKFKLFQTKRKYFPNHRTKLVWFGNVGGEKPKFGMVDIQAILPQLEIVNQNFPISLSIISNSRKQYRARIKKSSIPTKYFSWHKDSIFYQLKSHDICLIPINKNPFTICKTNNRLLLALSAGINVIADIIPSYQEFNGCLLFNNWEENIPKYINNKDLRRQHLSTAKSRIYNTYDRKKIIHLWDVFLQNCLTSNH